jgi:NHLM bacteriocin system ABC transporter peptidase/ATP-binding protein
VATAADAAADAGPPPVKRPTGRVRTPTVLQMEEVECGAAALATVLGYHGRIVPLERMRIECGVSRDGSKASNILKAARKYGMKAKGEQRDLSALAELPMPVILFWNFNHFVVLEGYAKGKYWINDPGSGPRGVPEADFQAAYTGVVLSFQLTPEFQPGGERRSLVRALTSRMGSKDAFVFAGVAGLALVIPGLVIPTFARIFVDYVLVSRLQEWYRPLLVGMTVTLLLRAWVTWLQERALARLQTRLTVSMSSRFLWHILRLPVEFYAQRYGGEVSARVAMNERLADFLASQLAARAIDAAMVVFFAALMFTYDLVLPLIGIGAVAILGAVTVVVNRRRVDGNRRLLSEEGKATGALMGGLANIETLKASAGESDLFARWAGYHAKFINSSQQLSTVTQTFLIMPPFVVGLTNVAVLAIGAARVIEGDLTLGMLVAFQSLMSSFTTPVQNLVNLASNLQEVQGQMNRLDDVLSYQVDPRTETRASAGQETGTKLSGHLELRGVTFGYSKLEKPLIENFNLTLRPGGRVALVGPSGSGKSTAAKLVTGLYEPWSGEVRFDGRHHHEVPRDVFANSVTVVDQDIALFGGTIRENLTLWDRTIPDHVVIQACQDAGIHDDITAREGGYEAMVEEGGKNFSGGQRQRLEIARALVTNPRILVLDEATSALDTVNEELIDRNLRRRGCTCIVVAHRLSTIRDAEEIVVLERGKVVQRGSHDELVKDPEGLYRRLVEQH